MEFGREIKIAVDILKDFASKTFILSKAKVSGLNRPAFSLGFVTFFVFVQYTLCCLCIECILI